MDWIIGALCLVWLAGAVFVAWGMADECEEDFAGMTIEECALLALSILFWPAVILALWINDAYSHWKKGEEDDHEVA